MSSNRIFFFVFLVTAAVSAFVLYNSISSGIQQSTRIAEREQKVIDQLKIIREAEIAYQAVNGQYTSDWNKLIKFINEGQFFIIEKKETVIPQDYGRDSIYVEIDTLGTRAVFDSLFAKYENFDVNRIAYVPGYENVKFKVYADKINKSGIMVDVIEVWNPKPVNPERDEDSEYTSKKPLRFGSSISVTTNGNWNE